MDKTLGINEIGNKSV